MKGESSERSVFSVTGVSYFSLHRSRFDKLAKKAQERYREHIQSVVVFGSAVNSEDPRDIDLLFVFQEDLNPRARHDRKLDIRGFIPHFDRDIEIRIMSVDELARLTPLHLGIAFDFEILADMRGLFANAMKSTKEIMAKWGTRKILARDGSWVILPRGELTGEPIDYESVGALFTPSDWVWGRKTGCREDHTTIVG